MDIHTIGQYRAQSTCMDELGAEAMPGALADIHRVIESLVAATRGDWARPLAADADPRT